ncbi:hypothetical protein BJ944DRAFT_245039 [Cunninghamella echinulata]|nr:hypothetical protein BJ944DRAFT_245039 [Cunninghamella echinulata]
MDLATILNPSTATATTFTNPFSSPPLSPKRQQQLQQQPSYKKRNELHFIKPRSRFSVLEDTIICEGVANGLTWGQISGQLPHRKRATCFNRYRTLQGIRKSRKPFPSLLSSRRASLPTNLLSSASTSNSSSILTDNHQYQYHHSSSWLPSPPPSTNSSLLFMGSPSLDLPSLSSPPPPSSSSFNYNCRRVSTCSLPPPLTSSYHYSRRSSTDSSSSHYSFYPS